MDINQQIKEARVYAKLTKRNGLNGVTEEIDKLTDIISHQATEIERYRNDALEIGRIKQEEYSNLLKTSSEEIARLRAENENLIKSNERLRFIARQHNPHLREDNV